MYTANILGFIFFWILHLLLLLPSISLLPLCLPTSPLGALGAQLQPAQVFPSISSHPEDSSFLQYNRGNGSFPQARHCQREALPHPQPAGPVQYDFNPSLHQIPPPEPSPHLVTTRSRASSPEEF